MENFVIKIVSSDKGNFILLSIVKRFQEDDSSMYYDEELIQFGKQFSNAEAIAEFKKTKFFLDALAACQGNKSHF